ncbi:hypothetical protein HDU76_014037 [Blyttiomyces sp. JEL0837]|nr:hypothetical protein HDU76_014037 [Blyttiomyces sp. JEL0837]
MYGDGLVAIDEVQLTLNDLKNLREIENDERQPLLDRIRASYTRAEVLTRLCEFGASAAQYEKTLDLIWMTAKDIEYLHSFVVNPFIDYANYVFGVASLRMTTVLYLVSEIAKLVLVRLVASPYDWEDMPKFKYVTELAKKYLELGNGPCPSISRVVKMLLKWPVAGTMMCATCRMIRYIVDDTQAIDIMMIHKLERCAKCKWVAYCSHGCQLLHWTVRGHRRVCRAPDDIRVGDIIMLKGLLTDVKMNGEVGRVVKKLSKSEGEPAQFVVLTCGALGSVAEMVLPARNLAVKIPAEKAVQR